MNWYTPALFAVLWVAPLNGAEQLKFEEASVKAASQCTFHNSIDPGMIVLEGDPLSAVLREAFKVNMDQINGPSWLDSDCFSIVAKLPRVATEAQRPEMLQALLVERFKLIFHKETHPSPGYALVVDKKGPKFKESDPDSPMVRGEGCNSAFLRQSADSKTRQQ